MKTLSSLPNGFVIAWYRNQSDQVKANVRRGLGLFPDSSQSKVPQENKSLSEEAYLKPIEDVMREAICDQLGYRIDPSL